MRHVVVAALTGFLGGMLASWLLMSWPVTAQARQADKLIVAERFLVVDAQGRKRGVWSAEESADGTFTGLVMLRADGKTPSLQLLVGYDGEAVVSFWDAQGKATKMVSR